MTKNSKLSEQVENYEFLGAESQKIAMQELFGQKKDLVIIHNLGICILQRW